MPEEAVASASDGAPPEAPRPRPPKLGVVPREVTLLPRHWDWLAAQPGGASVALRKLVEQARRDNEVRDRKRERQEAAYLFMCSLAGNLPGFEEATRALYADDRKRYAEQVASWPRMSATMPCGWRGKRTAARLEARVRQRLLRYAHRPLPTRRFMSDPAARNLLLYDGDCPFCSNYVQLMQLRKTIGPLDVLNMREHPELAVHFAPGAMT